MLNKKPTPILIVGMADSVHFARWVASIDHTKFAVRVFSSSPHRGVHPILNSLLQQSKSSSQISMGFVTKYFSLFLWLLDRPFLFADNLRGFLLRQEIRKFKPKVLHALETQNAGYLMLKARKLLHEKDVKTVLTLYGSDLYWFTRIPEHVNRIAELMRMTNSLHFECDRDKELAINLGFQGEFLPKAPAAPTPNFDVDIDFKHERNAILVKGYENKWGRGANAIKALAEVKHLLHGMKVIVISAEAKVPALARKLLTKNGVKVEVFRKGKLAHEDVIKKLIESQIYLGVSRSDGLPATLLEAMACGAYPIQTATSCAGEFLTDGTNAQLISDPDSVYEIATKLERALKNQSQVNDVRLANHKIAMKVYSSAPNEELLEKIYTRVHSK